MTIHMCECGHVATLKTGSGWECAECRRLNNLVDHPQDHLHTEPDGEDWDLKQSQRREYHRQYAEQRRSKLKAGTKKRPR